MEEDFPTILRFVDYTGEVLYDPKHIGFGFRPGPNANRKITGNMQLRTEFSESLTTEEYAIELEKAYDVNFPLQVALYKNGELILMPRSTQSHAEWLTEHNHNIKTDKIILLPKKDVTQLSNKFLPRYSKGTWDTTKTSPYFAEIKLFFDQLEVTLKSQNIITTRSEMNSIMLNGRGAIESEMYRLSKTNKDGSSSSSVVWNKDESTLNTWLVRLLNEIEKSSSVKNKDEATQIVKEIFEHYYKISGYTYKHPLYRSVKLTLYNVMEILVETGVIANPILGKLDDLLKANKKSGIKSLYISMYSNSKLVQRSSTISSKRDDIISIAENMPNTKFTASHKKNIQELFNDYIKIANDHRLVNKILAGFEKTYRVQLIQDLLDNCEPLRRVMAKDLPLFIKLVFNKDTHTLTNVFLSSKLANTPPLHSSVFEMIYTSFSWSTKTFKDLGIEMSYKEIKELRAEIKNTVFNWIINSKYQKTMFDGKLLRANDPVAPELDLVFSLWVAARRESNNPDFNMENTYKSHVFRSLKEGRIFSSNSLKVFRDTINKWAIQEDKEVDTDLRKSLSYTMALSKIATYAQIRKRSLRGPISKGTSNRGQFSKIQAKIYNVILGLGRHLGFDPASFRPVEDQMFDMNKGVKQMFKDLGIKLYIFIRHHFRNNPNRASIAITDQVIIDTRSHTFWEKLMSEDDARVATQVLENLARYNREVFESDIRNEFMLYGSEYSWIMVNWINDKYFADNLKIFNDRKDDVKALPILEFIKEHFPKAHQKFITTLLKDNQGLVRDIIQAMHPTIDISGLVNIGPNADYQGPFSTVFTEILKMYNHPVHF